MSQKFILVPSEMYQGLLSATSSSNQKALIQSKNEMDKVMNNPEINDNTKNLLYYQKLHNFLKEKKELEQKPLKVELSNAYDIESAQPLLIDPSSSIAKDEDDEYIKIPESVKEEIKKHVLLEQQKTPAPPKPQVLIQTPLVNALNLEPKKQVEDDTTPISRQPVNRTKIRDLTAHELYQHILHNRELYGLDSDYNLLSDRGQKIPNVNIKDAAEQVVNERLGMTVGTRSPKGKNLLRSRINQDEVAKKMLKEAVNKIQTKKVSFGEGFKPDRWRAKK